MIGSVGLDEASPTYELSTSRILVRASLNLLALNKVDTASRGLPISGRTVSSTSPQGIAAKKMPVVAVTQTITRLTELNLFMEVSSSN